MTGIARRYLGSALILILVLTSQAMAVARGAAGPAGLVELCTGTGPVVIAVDETGAPIGPAHFCPDCVLAVIALSEVTRADPAPIWRETRLSAVPVRRRAHPGPWPAAMARGPPAAV